MLHIPEEIDAAGVGERERVALAGGDVDDPLVLEGDHHARRERVLLVAVAQPPVLAVAEGEHAALRRQRQRVARAGRHPDHLLEAQRPDLLRHQLVGLIAMAQLACFFNY